MVGRWHEFARHVEYSSSAMITAGGGWIAWMRKKL
jgi:hypothetical protein